jgi:hypothetical protein
VTLFLGGRLKSDGEGEYRFSYCLPRSYEVRPGLVWDMHTDPIGNGSTSSNAWLKPRRRVTWPVLRRNPVRLAQKLLANGKAQYSKLGSSLRVIVSDCLWRHQKTEDGKPFNGFPAFATAAQPYGLGVTTQDAMDEFGTVLKKCGLYGPWRDLLEATTRSRGQPRKNLAVSENKIPIFKLPTSHTALAKRLMLLSKRHPAIFADLEAGKLSWTEAVDTAGLSSTRRRRTLRMGVWDLERARSLSEGGQIRLLREVFTTMSLDAQCHLLANVVEPATGASELAARWRSHARSARRS